MPQIENPTATGRASWKSLVGASKDCLTLSAYRAQHLIVAHGVRPDLAAMLAAIAFGGGANG